MLRRYLLRPLEDLALDRRSVSGEACGLNLQ